MTATLVLPCLCYRLELVCRLNIFSDWPWCDYLELWWCVTKLYQNTQWPPIWRKLSYIEIEITRKSTIQSVRFVCFLSAYVERLDLFFFCVILFASTWPWCSPIFIVKGGMFEFNPQCYTNQTKKNIWLKKKNKKIH